MTLPFSAPTTESPSFCIIAPTAYLEQYAINSNTHLVLAHLVDADEAYAAFYLQRRVAGDFIIMDNGAFELLESYTPSKLIELGQKCGAHALVLPDYPFQPAEKTIQAAEQYIPLFKDAGFNTFFVPQSERGETKDWIRSYTWATSNPNIDIIGMSILGIPNALPHIPASYARVVMTELLQDRGLFAYKYHHYLGLNAGPNVELPALIEMRALNSCDSSNPVWSGINGIRYNPTYSDWMGVQKKYLREVDFGTPMTDKSHIHGAIAYNIHMTLSLFEREE